MPWWRRKRSDEDFAEEIRAHLDLEQSDLESEGIAGREARFSARRAFGNVAAVQERYHEKRRWVWAGGWLADAAYALRLLRRTPAFTSAAILILAFAIGASLTSWSLVDALMLRSMPVARPDELVLIDDLSTQGRLLGLPTTALDALRKEPVFRGVCGITTPRMIANIDGAIASLGTLAMTGDCFQTLGVSTHIGRPLTMADDLPEAPNVTILSAALWRKAFGASPAALGRQIQVGSETFTVVGVADDGFTGVLLGFQPGLLIPVHHTPGDIPQKRFADHWVSVFARRAPGVSQAATAARIAVLTPSLLEQSVPRRYNEAQRRRYLASRLVVSSARTGVDWMLRDRFGRPLYALLGICAAVLLIACLNLAGLLVARTLGRQKEVGIRLAIGATPWRVMRPLALESLLLAFTGGALGLLFAQWGSRAVVAAASAMFSDFTIDSSLTSRGYVCLAGMLAWVAAALTVVPVWQARRSARIHGLRDAGRGVVGGKAHAQKVLIAIQVAFTLALVTAGGVFASSFTRLLHLPLGVHAQGLAEAMISPVPGGYNMASPKSYYAGLLERVALIPGVESASLSSFALYWHKEYPELVRTEDGSHELRVQTIGVTESYFTTIGAPLQSGVAFRREDAEPEAIVSESADRLLGGGLQGRYITIGENGSTARYRVIGVAPTMRISMADARDPAPAAVYLNFWQIAKDQRYPVLFVRGVRSTLPDAKALGAAVQSLGREYLETWRPVETARDEAIVEDRLLAWLAAIFALLTLLLAAAGLFAILSCYVSRRTSEIGVRMALGARAAQIRGLVLSQVGLVMAAGIAAGLVLALAAGRLLEGVAFGMTAHDPTLLAVAILSLLVTGLAAAWIPARRAANIHPLEALRQD